MNKFGILVWKDHPDNFLDNSPEIQSKSPPNKVGPHSAVAPLRPLDSHNVERVAPLGRYGHA